MSESKEIQQAVALPTFSLSPTSFKEAQEIANYLATSDLVPKDYQGKAANIVVAMAWGAEVGLKTLQALSNIAVINGRGSIWGDAALALCTSRRDFVNIKEEFIGEGDNRKAVCTVWRANREPVIREFSVADAKRAGLWQTEPMVTRKGQNNSTYQVKNDSPWWKYPDRMLQMRARGFALRDSFPDAMRGLYLAEELQGEIEINAAPAAQTKQQIIHPQERNQAEEIQPESVLPEEQMDEFLGRAEAMVKEKFDEVLQSTNEVKPEEKPATQTGGAVISGGMLKTVRTQLTRANIEEIEILKQFEVAALELLPLSQINTVLDWIKTNAKV